uniref:Neutral ceramidase n=1 Tax=Pyricularia oryzae (strain P131) TaxID=1143193 RepID=L7JMZ5_PYRO1
MSERQVEAHRLLSEYPKTATPDVNSGLVTGTAIPRRNPRKTSPSVAFLSIVTAALLSLSFLFITCSSPATWTWLASTLHPSLQHAETGGAETGNAGAAADRYLIGVGKADITGPVVEINLMGYADPNQVGSGLRQRLYSRAFMVGDLAHPADRFVYLVLDTQSGDTAVRYGIISALQSLGPEYAHYGHHNVAVTGTHSHSGPGGWLNYLLPQITSKGFDHQGYRAIVDGAVLSIRRAHESLTPGYLYVGKTKVAGANINRSLFAYLANPEVERNRYNVSSEDDGSVEKEMTLLKFQRASDWRHLGILTWFPTHGTSMLGNNTLITGDNKGVAAYLFEKSMRYDVSAVPGVEFVAGFSQASVGDTSPNVKGAWCEDGSGLMCSFENSTCADGKAQACHARGPFFGRDDGGTASCFEIGMRQFKPARELYDKLLLSEGTRISGGMVKSFHTFHDMSRFEFAHPRNSSQIIRTCPAALGYSFAAGTSDGPGVFDFTQHDGDSSNTSPVWRAVSNMLKKPSDEQVACHAPKPILLDVGEVSRPYQWTPNIVDVQLFRVGQLAIIVSPGEATTMAGRRWKESVERAFVGFLDTERNDADGNEDSDSEQLSPIVVLGGPANSYTHYITTEEEYGIQRYEGASTLYGPHTLDAYINGF